MNENTAQAKDIGGPPRWLWYLAAGLFAVAAVFVFINRERTRDAIASTCAAYTDESPATRRASCTCAARKTVDEMPLTEFIGRVDLNEVMRPGARFPDHYLRCLQFGG